MLELVVAANESAKPHRVAHEGDPEKITLSLLKQYGTLIRARRNKVYAFFGHRVSIPPTNTDRRGWLNKLAELRRIMKEAHAICTN